MTYTAENERIYLSPPHMNGREMDYIRKAFDTNWIAPLGDNVDELEQRLGTYLDGQQAVALCSGTAGIHLALQYAGVGPGDKVFCSDVTFIGSCNPICYLGAEPVFIDCDDNWNMDPECLRQALTEAQAEGKLPGAVIVVDLYGLPADYDRIVPLCEEFGVPLIEDAAEALGSEYRGRKCGTFGTMSVLSFNANKVITTSGGGMVLTADPVCRDKLKFWATQSREPVSFYLHREVGYNYRLSNISAGIGCGQLACLSEFVNRRRAIYRDYQAALEGYPVSFYPDPDGSDPNCWLTVMMIEDNLVRPEQLIRALEDDNIESRRFWKPMHTQPLFRHHSFYRSAEQPVGERLFERGICLPSGTAMDERQQQQVVAAVKACFDKGR